MYVIFFILIKTFLFYLQTQNAQLPASLIVISIIAIYFFLDEFFGCFLRFVTNLIIISQPLNCFVLVQERAALSSICTNVIRAKHFPPNIQFS